MNLNYHTAIKAAKNERSEQRQGADSLAQRKKTRLSDGTFDYLSTERATSKQIQLNRERLSDSLSDVFERACCMGFMSEDDVRHRMYKLSAFLNRPRGE